MKSVLSTLILTLTCIFFLPAKGQPFNQSSPQAQSVETSKPVINIEVKDNLLSVEASDAEFGQVIKQIAEKAKFKAEISGDVAAKKISTNFKGLDMEKGIRRLLNIIKQQDYTMSYKPSGSIDKIEIYGSSVLQPLNSSSYKTPSQQIQTSTPQPVQRPTPQQVQRPIPQPASNVAPTSPMRPPLPPIRTLQPQRPPQPSQKPQGTPQPPQIQQPASPPPAQQVPTIPVENNEEPEPE